MDFSKASWFLLGFGVEVGLAPNTPPTPSFKTFCDLRGYAKGIMPCIVGERSIFRFLCWEECLMFQNIGGGLNHMGPS
jgi:hypothetical protein